MDETGDAPEHPWVRWYQGLSAVERFTIQIAAVLFGFGVFLAAVGFGLTSAAAPVSALLDRLGWSLIQLGGAIVVVQVVLHRRSTAEQKHYIQYKRDLLIDNYIVFSANEQMCMLYDEHLLLSNEFHRTAQEHASAAITRIRDLQTSADSAMATSPELFKLYQLIQSILRSELGLVNIAQLDRPTSKLKQHPMVLFLSRRLCDDYSTLEQHLGAHKPHQPLSEPMRCVRALSTSMSYSTDPAEP